MRLLACLSCQVNSKVRGVIMQCNPGHQPSSRVAASWQLSHIGAPSPVGNLFGSHGALCRPLSVLSNWAESTVLEQLKDTTSTLPALITGAWGETSMQGYRVISASCPLSTLALDQCLVRRYGALQHLRTRESSSASVPAKANQHKSQ